MYAKASFEEGAAAPPVQEQEGPSNASVDRAEPQSSSARAQKHQTDHHRRQTSHPSEQAAENYAYDSSVKRKRFNIPSFSVFLRRSKPKVTELHEQWDPPFRQAAARLPIFEQENISLRSDLSKLQETNALLESELSRLKQKNKKLGVALSSWKDGHAILESELSRREQKNKSLESDLGLAENFLKVFEVKDFTGAETEWSKDKEELSQIREKFSKLQGEVLSSVERFNPSFDSQVHQDFVQLNSSIGRLSKSKELKEIVLQGNPLAHWDTSALWADSVHPSIETDGPSDKEKRLLLRQTIWKFISEELFDRSYPLASFGGFIGGLESLPFFDKLFPDHEVNENAGKWRSITVRQLSALQQAGDGSYNEEDFLEKLKNRFTAYIQEKLAPGIDRERLDSLLNTAVLNKRLREVFERSIKFSRLIMTERAAFTIETPHLSEMKFTRVEDDSLTTGQGVVVGVNDGNDTEVDLVGSIKLVGSPFLRKHGDGGGKNLDRNMIIVRAFVLIDP
ncbi:hypothetical protein TWF481_010328 [Arthrobotrys musiformis]|uniref:Uncharacterized protein n=1 Tax=Arthrobotrys musiformis TaxID=47236 RepID=A0AAV9W2M0_9PEZI